MNKKQCDIITGLVLSDAHLRKPKPSHRVHMTLTLYQYKFDFGQYFDANYKAKSYENSLAHINEFEYVNENTILVKEKTNAMLD